MHLLAPVSVAVFLSFVIVLSEGSPWQVSDNESKPSPVASSTERQEFVGNGGECTFEMPMEEGEEEATGWQEGDKDEELLGDSDFEDDYPNALPDFVTDQSVYSITHLHKKGGEVLIPCFGMWWPIGGGGGGGPVYDYEDDYYGDYRRRRRSRRKKKAAKMKRKKS